MKIINNAFLSISAVVAIIILYSSSAVSATLAETFSANNPESSITVNHQAWDALVNSYIVESEDGINRFRYADVSAEDKATLKNYIETTTQIDPLTLTADAQKAYWINLYNAITIDVVLAAYPIDTIRKIDAPIFRTGPWKKDRVTVNEEDLSLDNIEHDILRPIFKDPRIHYGVNCASIGCPNLQNQAFTAANIEALLTEGAIDYVNHPRGATVKNGKLVVSSIYDWFVEDFGNNDAGVIAHLKQYANEALQARLANITAINDDDYDWDLNE